MRKGVFLLIALWTVGVWACGAARKSPSGFHLPDGNIERGKAAFLALKCDSCHRVAGVDLPAPTVKPAVPVVLGGRVPYVKTDGELVSSIIDPSYVIAGYPPEQVQTGGRSRMRDYGDVMTVRQLADIVEFLQSRYVVERPTYVR